jgi:hypothetical protein
MQDQDISQDLDPLDNNDPNLIFGGSNEDLIEDDEYLEFSRAPQDELEYLEEPQSIKS